MDKQVVFDTSTWIIGFREDLGRALKECPERFLSEKRVVITQLIILELLTGAKNQKEYAELYEDLTALECIEITPEVWESAYKISFNLRRRGYAIPAVDTIIASLCLKHNFLLLHADRHYELIKNYYHLHTQFIK